MVQHSHQWTNESEVFSIFPTFVWKIQLKRDLAERINTKVRASLHAENPRLVDLAPGEGWQSGHQLQMLEEYSDLVACMRSARTVLKFLKIGYQAIELTGCLGKVGARGASHAMPSHPNNFLRAYISFRFGLEPIRSMSTIRDC